MAYQVFDAAAYGFPRPRVPVLPTWPRTATAAAAGARFEALGADRPGRRYTRGRYALHDAYRLCGVGPQGPLLAPAYHCRTMLDPAIRLQAPVSLYPLLPNLAPDLDAIAKLVDAAPYPPRALLLTHFFGFAADAAPIADYCRSRGIALIEDCSHALLDHRGARRLGHSGRYVVASPYKFFPSEEGGLLLAEPTAALPELRPAGIRAELRTLWHSWQRGQSRAPLANDLARLDDDIAAAAAQPIDAGDVSRRESAGTSALYDPREEGLAATRASTWLASTCDIDTLALRRRANYQRWLAALQGVAQARPLFDRLPEGTVPYMFPLLIEHPRPHFYILKRLGMPVWRWDDMADSGCALSQHLREHLLHLPCHQALSDDELDWMTAAITKVLRLPAAAPPHPAKRIHA